MNKVRFQAELMALKDEGYKEFNQKLIPNVPAETMIGIRTPVLRNLAKRLFKERKAECMEFLEELPHYQKARESRQISPERKEYLKTLKV